MQKPAVSFCGVRINQRRTVNGRFDKMTIPGNPMRWFRIPEIWFSPGTVRISGAPLKMTDFLYGPTVFKEKETEVVKRLDVTGKLK